MVVAEELCLGGIVPEESLHTLPFITAEESQNAQRDGDADEAGEDARALAL